MLSWRQSTKKYKGRIVLRGDIVKGRFWFLCSIHRTRIISISNDSRQNHGYHLQIAKLRWTSSIRSISSYPSKNGRCSQIVENSQIGVSQTFGFVYHDTNGQNHGPVWKTHSSLFNGFFLVIRWQDYNGKGNLRKSY